MVARWVGAWGVEAATAIGTWAPIAGGTAAGTAAAGAAAAGTAAAGTVIAGAVTGTVAGTAAGTAMIGTSVGSAAGRLGAVMTDPAICDCDGMLSVAASLMKTTGTWEFNAAGPSSEDSRTFSGTSMITSVRSICSSSQPTSDAWEERLVSSSCAEEPQVMLVSALTSSDHGQTLRKFTLRMDGS